MASGGSQTYRGTFVGVAASFTVDKIPFAPKAIKFFVVDTALTPDLCVGYKTDEMSGNNYISTIGADTGVTLAADGFDIANGADINRTGKTTYYECTD